MYLEFALNAQGIFCLVNGLYATRIHLFHLIIPLFCSVPILLDFFFFFLVFLIFPFITLFPIFTQNHHCNPDLQTLENCSKASGLKTTPAPQTHKKMFSLTCQQESANFKSQRYHFTPMRLAKPQVWPRPVCRCVCKPVEQLELPTAAGCNANWQNCFGEQAGNMIGGAKMPSSFDTKTSLLGRDHRETINTCTGRQVQNCSSL